MPEEFEPSNEDERLKAENDFLKMKLMLEQGAIFGSVESEGTLSPEIENMFLNNIIAFEEQFQNRRTIKIYDKIGRPTHFLPVSAIGDDDIERAWKDLHSYLEEHEILLDVCSPNVSVRELYRFTIEELFELETNDIDLPGWTTTFIYDEFHPDPVYDNMRAAIDDCISCIISKEPIEFTHHFRHEKLRLNGHTSLSIEELKSLTNRFKLSYDSIEIERLDGIDCIINKEEAIATGSYAIKGSIDRQSHLIKGGWKVIFNFDAEYHQWFITEIDIEGIAF